MPSAIPPVILRHLGTVAYSETFEAMRRFTAERGATTPDELWLLQHPATFTQGRHGKAEHLLDSGEIPVVQVDRGGQVTYHGPGQLVAYLLLDMRRRRLGVRQLVTRMEQAVIELLAGYGIDATAHPDAPGVYVDGAKIAALGLRVTRGCSYHGLSLNIEMDLSPFKRINPCGYPELEVIDLRHLGITAPAQEIRDRLEQLLLRQLDAKP